MAALVPKESAAPISSVPLSPKAGAAIPAMNCDKETRRALPLGFVR